MPHGDPSIVEPVLISTGIAFQLVGAYITYRGFRQGWNDTKSETDRFMAPAVHFFDRIGSTASRLVRRALRRSSSNTIQVRGADAATSAERVLLKKGWPPIPEGTSDREAIDELTRRINAIQNDVDRHGSRQSDQQQSFDEFVKSWSQQVQREAEDERVRQLGGLRMEAFGFLILTVGGLIQGVGSYFG